MSRGGSSGGDSTSWLWTANRESAEVDIVDRLGSAIIAKPAKGAIVRFGCGLIDLVLQLLIRPRRTAAWVVMIGQDSQCDRPDRARSREPGPSRPRRFASDRHCRRSRAASRKRYAIARASTSPAVSRWFANASVRISQAGSFAPRCRVTASASALHACCQHWRGDGRWFSIETFRKFRHRDGYSGRRPFAHRSIAARQSSCRYADRCAFR